MKNYSLIAFLFLLFTVGCKKETIAPPDISNSGIEAISKAINYQKVTTIDGNVTSTATTIETLKSGEIYLMSIPANWNGDLILYAHGYVSPFLPLALPTEADLYVPLFTSQGYAFATTSYSENGLVIQNGIDDIADLRKAFIKEYGEPNHIYLAGGSEGGLVTTLSIEENPKLYSGGLSLCGPCGDFQRQINYYSDFRVLFDYFFPSVLPGNAVNIPDELIADWQTVYVPAILQAISSNPVATLKLLNTSGASFDPSVSTSISTTVLGLLWYDVHATRDAIARLKGQPFDNIDRFYSGTGSAAEDIQLNNQVQRFSADPKAMKNIQKYYQTTGDITIPLVASFNTGDPIVPFWQEPLYQVKIDAQGASSLFTGIPVQRYGHCNFTEAEIIQAFGLLVQKVQGQTLIHTQQLINLSNTTNGKIVRSVTN